MILMDNYAREDRKMKKKILVFILVSLLFAGQVFVCLPKAASASEGTAKSGRELNISDVSGYLITVTRDGDRVMYSVNSGAPSDEEIVIYGTGANCYVIINFSDSSGIDAKITLKNLSIDNRHTNYSPVSISGTGNVTIELEGTNQLIAADGEAAIETPQSGTLTIQNKAGKEGKLVALGGANAAGIGGRNGGNGENIIIKSGTIEATGGENGAGIGGGYEGDGSNITITGGTVTANGGDYGAGIGGGKCENEKGGNGSEITITGGKVTANAGEYGAGIGGGYEGDGFKIRIEDGTIRAKGGRHDGTGIGGGWEGEGKEITITGGMVTASAKDGGAGIGGGERRDGHDITITGGTVIASSLSGGAGIGGGEGGNGYNITITGEAVVKAAGGDISDSHSAAIGQGNMRSVDGSNGAESIITVIATIEGKDYEWTGEVWRYPGGKSVEEITKGTVSGTQVTEAKITFDANGGSGTMNAATIIPGNGNKLPANEFTREEYFFTGWNTKSDGSGASYGDEAVVNFVGSIMLYAQWKKLITGDGISVTEGHVTYIGTPQTPAMVVKDGETTLTKGTDYTVSYEDINGAHVTEIVDAGAYTVVIAGKGNYTGELTVMLTVNPKALTADMVETIQDVVYNGKVQKPTGVVNDIVGDGRTTLFEGKDYTVSYKDSNGTPVREIVDAGAYTVVIAGKGNYTGQVEKTFTVYPKALKDYGDTVSTTFDGQVRVLHVKDDGRTLVEGEDYSITYKDSNGTSVQEIFNTGEYTALITGKGNYTGEKITKITVNPKSLTAEMVMPVQDVVYNGKVQTPAVIVKDIVGDSQTTLTEGKDYTVSYKDSNGMLVSEIVEPGTYTVTIKGIGNFSGTMTSSVTILPSSAKKYVVKFVDEDGTELQSSVYAYGDMPKYYGEIPSGAPDVVCSAEFSGWDKEVVTVRGDEIYTATYKKYNEHDYQPVDGTAIAPTCTKAGKEADQKCSRCDAVITGKEIAATGHTFNQEVVDEKYLKSAADCVTAAVYYKSCKCGEKSTDEKDIFTSGEPAGHKWKAATGYAPKTCEVCGLEEGQKVTYDPIKNQVFVWTKGSKEPFVLTIKRSQDDVNCFLHYLNTLLDGAEIKVEARSGSTIITIPAETLEKLAVGEHMITIVFDDWKADFALSIAEAVDATPTTGDTSMPILWATLILLSMAGATVVVMRRRKRA